MTTESMPLGRIIMRIVAWHMSAVFMHMAMHFAMSSMPEEAHMSAHIVQDCSQAVHDSMHCCIIIMSMPGISLSSMAIIGDDIMSIIALFPR